MFNIDSLIEVTLEKPDDFLKVKETLTRIGIASKTSNVLFQSCHILHKQGKYYIVHFKELFLLDGKTASLTDNDLGRRNTITNLLSDWKLVKLVDKNKTATPIVSPATIKIISFTEKKNWTLNPKYQIGNVKVKKMETE